jgi:hypothetical protein
MQEKKTLAGEAGKRHQKTQKKEKALILNEPVKTTVTAVSTFYTFSFSLPSVSQPRSSFPPSVLAGISPSRIF